MMTTTIVLLLLLLIFLTALAQVPQCTLDGNFSTTELLPSLRATCSVSTDILRVQLIYNPEELLGNYPEDFGVEVFYECTNNESMVRTGLVNGLDNVVINDDEHKVILNETFVEAGASCTVLGCWNFDSRFTAEKIFTIQNNTCSFSEPVATTPTSTSLLDTSTEAMTTPLLDNSTSGSPDVSTIIPSATVQSTQQGMTDPVILTPLVTSSLILPRKTPSATVPDRGNESRDQVIMAVFLVIFLCIVVATVLVLVGILLKFRQTQRKKKSIMRYYNYSEPIDPYFSPIDIHAQIKEALSVMSVFDTFSPYLPHPDDSDDNRSEVLQGTGQTEDNSSIKSIVFKDDSEVVLSSQALSKETNKIDASIKDSVPKEALELTPVSDNCLSADEVTVRQSSTVSGGYVVERPYSPSTVVLQSPVSDGYVQHESKTRVVPVPLNLDQTEQRGSHQFHTQLSCSTSSGYVTGDTMRSPSGYVTESDTSRVPGGYVTGDTMRSPNGSAANSDTRNAPGGFITESDTMQCPGGFVPNSDPIQTQTSSGYLTDRNTLQAPVTDPNKQDFTQMGSGSSIGYVADLDLQLNTPRCYVTDSRTDSTGGYVHEQVSPISPANSGYVIESDKQDFHTQESSTSSGYVIDSNSQSQLRSPGCTVSEPREQECHTQSKPFPQAAGGYVIEKAFETQSHSLSCVTDPNTREFHTPRPSPHGSDVIESSKEFHTQLSSTSSGYVTGPNTPESSLHSIGLSAVVNMKPLTKHASLENSYTIVLSRNASHSTAPPRKEPKDHTSSEKGEEQDSENMVTKCSLSINPLHFEPVNYNELMQGHTSPSYVNTVSNS